MTKQQLQEKFKDKVGKPIILSQQEEKVLYRYDSYCYDNEYGEMKIYLTEYRIIRETEKSYVIDYPSYSKRPTFVLKGDGGKRFAYATKEAAYNGFLARTRRRVLIAQGQLERAQRVLKLAEDKEKLLSLTYNRFH